MTNSSAKRSRIDYFEYAKYVLACICFGYFLLYVNRPKMFEPLLIVLVLLVLRWGQQKTADHSERASRLN